MSAPPRARARAPLVERVEMRGHLVDSGLLARALDGIVENRCRFEIESLEIGRTNRDASHAVLRVTAADPAALRHARTLLSGLGATALTERDARFLRCPRDRVAPEGFYSTTNHHTWVRRRGRWVAVQEQKMDALVVQEGRRLVCRKFHELRRGAPVVCGLDGVRVVPESRPRDRDGFAFMQSEVSSEKWLKVAVRKVGELIRSARSRDERVVFVAGPVVVHTGGVGPLASLIRRGWVDALLAGNALAVHDAEQALYGTSLGVDLRSGRHPEGGHQNHLRAINVVTRAGSLARAVRSGLLRSGVVHEAVRRGIPIVLAGSLRDDGPLPDTITDMVQAQKAYVRALAGAGVVLILGSMLHGIAVGNLIPAWVRTVTVDVNPAVPTKLGDRGSSQAVGIVADAGQFLHLLDEEL